MKEVCYFTRFGKVKKDVANLKYEKNTSMTFHDLKK